MKIGIVGCGYVGLVTGICFAELGFKVTFHDRDAAKINAMQTGIIPVYEPGLQELFDKNKEDISFSESADIYFICVGTPSKDDGSCDLTQVMDAISKYSPCVIKSTVPVGTAREGVISNPEFLREGSAIQDFMHPDRIIIGCREDQQEMMRSLYRFIDAPILFTSNASAELIKQASNAFLAAKITFINQLSHLAEKTGADIDEIAQGIGMDRRIGPQFLKVGPGYGGSCFPKDTTALSHIARTHGVELGIVDATIRGNQEHLLRCVSKILAVPARTIGVLGLTFKANTDDVRESPAIGIINLLYNYGYKIKVFDPKGMPNAKKILAGKVQYCENAYEAARDSDCLVIATEWEQFKEPSLVSLMNRKVVVDLRNLSTFPAEYHPLGKSCTGTLQT